jgi:hypothetical protein
VKIHFSSGKTVARWMSSVVIRAQLWMNAMTDPK